MKNGKKKKINRNIGKILTDKNITTKPFRKIKFFMKFEICNL